jgi:hypothetical protein
LAELLAAAGDRADRVSDTRSASWAIGYLAASRPTSVLAPAPLNPADQLRLAHIQADQIVGVIRAVLNGLELTDADYTRGIDLAIKELRASSSQGWEPL